MAEHQDKSPSDKQIDLTKSFHIIKDKVTQSSYLGKHCQTILDHLDLLYENTWRAAPIRDKGLKYFDLPDRKKRAKPPEAKLERSILSRWGANSYDHGKEQFLAYVCRYVRDRQVPLFGRGGKKKWGSIDLLGVGRLYLPVVLELKVKTGSTPESPLRMLVEALAYAIAIRKAWNEPKGQLQVEWADQVHPPDGAQEHPHLLERVPIIGIAPTDYWERCTGDIDKPGSVKPDCWLWFRKLVLALEARGYPATFVELCSCGKSDADKLSARIIELPR